MATDMTDDVFAETAIGQAALKEWGAVPENFRIYLAVWLGDHPNYSHMKVVGAEFRPAKTGPNKGSLSIKIPRTERTVYLSKSQIQAAAKAEGGG
jgi:hypothetical protein